MGQSQLHLPKFWKADNIFPFLNNMMQNESLSQQVSEIQFQNKLLSDQSETCKKNIAKKNIKEDPSAAEQF